jgi:hypothetical protein
MPRKGSNADVDVETVANDDLIDTPEATGTKEPKAKKEPARGELPEGYVTPVGFAKVLGERGLQTDREGNVLKEVKPQMVYSYMKNAPKDDPFPTETVTDSLGHERQALKVDAGVAWWEKKNTRTAERKQNAKAKADKAAERAAAKANAPAEAEGEATEAE